MEIGHSHRRLLVVAVAGVLAGSLLQMVMTLDGSSGPEAVGDGGQPSASGIIAETLTWSTDDAWHRGKVQTAKTTIRGGRLGITAGETSLDYWESRTLDLANVSQLTVYATVPDGTAATAKVITSTTPRFEAPDGSYRRADEQTFTVTDGWNRYTVKPFDESYYRLFFSLSRDAGDTQTPAIVNATLHGMRNSSEFLYPPS